MAKQGKQKIQIRSDAEWYCPHCGFREELGEKYYTLCPRCGKPLTIRYNEDMQRRLLERLRDYKDLLELLPVRGISLGEGRTPLVDTRLEHGIGLFVKMEHLNPSGSFKDRGASLAIAYAYHLGYRKVVEDTSGNTGISVALYSRAYRMNATIVMPRGAPRGKKRVAKILASKILLASNREEARILARRVAEKGALHVNHLASPFFVEGAKWIAYETLLLDMEGNDVDAIILPVGSGGLFLGFYYAVRDMLSHGLISRKPRLIAVEGCSTTPVYEKIHGKRAGPECGTSFLADGLRVEKPPRLGEIVDAIKSTDGCVVLVNDEEIRRAYWTAIRRGYLIEPTSATVLAAAQKARSRECIGKGESILTVFTGSGLKQ